MTIAKWRAYASVFAPRHNLFLLSHMRSFSSVLSHVLGSHPQIDGYFEAHIKYRRPLDLLHLRARVIQLTGEPLTGRYVLDKILHDYPLSPGILRSGHTRAILSVRRPAETVQSIVNLGLHYATDLEWYRNIDEVARYYERRLQALLRVADELRGRSIFVEAESLKSRTTEVLERLTAFLELNEPLQPDYRRFPHTGRRRVGDSSQAILTGRLSSTATSIRTPITIPLEVSERLEGAYRVCSAALRERCTTVA